MANANIEVKETETHIGVTVNDPALLMRYEKSCGSDSEKILAKIEDFLSRN